MKTYIKKLRFLYLIPLCLSLNILPTHAAIIGADGGVTLYISYDNPDVPGGASWNDNVTQVNSASGASCSPTNNARSAQGAPASPGSCLIGDTCAGKEKLTGDIENLAEYIYTSTHGNHYLRRVYLSDNGRSWSTADIRWSIGGGGSSSPSNGWVTPGSALSMRSSTRRCIHDVVHHELGHYFYNLPDRYARGFDGYYEGSIGGGPDFDVSVDIGDPNTVMSGNFPHRFVDTTNAQLTVSYNPGTGLIAGEVLTPGLLADANPANDGPDRAHHGHTMPFAQDEWSILPTRHADLSGAHTEGDFSEPDLALMPPVDIRFLGEDDPHPGTVLLLDRSGSMSVTTNGIPASQYVQEAGMYLYHSSLDGDFVGTQLYNGAVETLFDYDVYDINNQLPFANFRNAAGLTNIAAALESGIDTLIAQHGEDGVNGGQLFLMSDGVQTTGASLWDQVTRAMEKGIQIHTLSFGQADSATMDAIATSTDGEVVEMSEISDGDELKLGMNRELSEIRGFTPVYFYKGKLKTNKSDKYSQYHQGEFIIPRNNRALQFYVFAEPGDASTLDLELEDSNGNIFTATPFNVASKGRLNGITVAKPLPGKWIYRIKGSRRHDGRLPHNTDYEVIAQVMNNDLDTDLSLVKAGAQYGGQYKIQASLNHRYPLTGLDAVANLYRGNTLLVSIKLNDDADKPDLQKTDGIFSGLFNPARYDISPDRMEKLRLDVVFTTSEKTIPAPNSHYETGVKWEALNEDYIKIAKTTFRVFATDVVSFNDKDEFKPRISSIQPRKTQKVHHASAGKLQVVIDNAFISKSLLKISLGQGIDAQVADILPEPESFRTKVTIYYKVTDAAKPGNRDLLIQSNQIRLSSPGVLTVSH